jgi:hypothetical protein
LLSLIIRIISLLLIITIIKIEAVFTNIVTVTIGSKYNTNNNGGEGHSNNNSYIPTTKSSNGSGNTSKYNFKATISGNTSNTSPELSVSPIVIREVDKWTEVVSLYQTVTLRDPRNGI